MFHHVSVPDMTTGLQNVVFGTPAEPASSRDTVRALQDDIERLLMITEALWQILKEQHGYTDDELMRRVTMIDLQDGKLDGKVAKAPPAECPKCGRMLNKRHSTCIYCGEPVVQSPFRR